MKIHEKAAAATGRLAIGATCGKITRDDIVDAERKLRAAADDLAFALKLNAGEY